ncbi:MAG: thioredoxin family protein [Gemmataceae bacterium]|nr:thioredoxin family protein [Gemmataceae bacterium]MDW8266987.1 thioredoxin family protein [Gemmataceae bacterium]
MNKRGLGCWALLVLGLTIRPAAAADVPWRHEYAAARREAQATGKPLLLDFGTEQCFWCKKLDATTFRDPQVVRLLRERFVSLRIDGHREVSLTRALAIHSYPTLVVATPEGKIVGRQDGYVDASGMLRLLQRALAQMPPAASGLETVQAPAAAPPAAAVPLQPLPPPQVAVRTTACPAEVADVVADRQARAQALLAQAQRDLEEGCPLSCLERCRLLTSDYPDLAEAGAARAISRRILGEGAPDAPRAADIDSHLGELYVELAGACLRRQQYAEASVYLERATHLVPESAAAQKVRDQLERLRSELAKPTTPVIRAQSP